MSFSIFPHLDHESLPEKSWLTRGHGRPDSAVPRTTHGTLHAVTEGANVEFMIVVCIAVAMVGGPLGLLMLRSRRSHRFGRGEIDQAIDVAAGWRHMHGG